ncbi:UNVERIFIED_CONTAM: hypothetical protein K2H54_045343 [Gekko kuhli]
MNPISYHDVSDRIRDAGIFKQIQLLGQQQERGGYGVLQFTHHHPTRVNCETTELGNKKELKSMPFITYLSGLLSAQMLSDDQLITGVEIRCEEKGRCPSTCHLCRRPGKEQLSPMPVLLEINRVVPLYTLIQDNETREVSCDAPQRDTRGHTRNFLLSQLTGYCCLPAPSPY